MNAETAVADLPGIGPKRAAALASREIITVLDALMHLPVRYQDWRIPENPPPLAPDSVALITGTLKLDRIRSQGRWRRPVSGVLDSSHHGRLRLVWFNLPAYLKDALPDGQHVAILGRVTKTAEGALQMVHPDVRSLDEVAATPIRPVYRLPAEIGQRLWIRTILKVLDEVNPDIVPALAGEPRERAGLPPLATALRELHAPGVSADLAALRDGSTTAHRALAIDEMFAFQLGLAVERSRRKRRRGIALGGQPRLTAALLAGLPFSLTDAQRRAIDEIGADLNSARPMNRLLMGDVGSGKTLVALWAVLRAVESGLQAVVMAPTELLAEQHHQSFARLCGGLGIEAGILTGRVMGARRAAILRRFASGDTVVLFGTHALIQRDVKAARLGLAVIDEQHRFGVFQRARLKELGRQAHLLMMTATPIPRSLAMLLFANLDLSVLDEMPAGRVPIESRIVPADEMSEADAAVEAEVARGNRAFYIAPLIDGEEDVPSVIEMAKRLGKGRLGRFQIGVLHGRMRSDEKERVMRSFRDGALDLLISTTVVEVGIDVPAASIIVILAAERYGLAQLHQLRGRVGRGETPSKCILVVSPAADTRAKTRLRRLAESRSGDEVARADLELRGPGDLLGARQAGALPLRFARFIRDPMDIDLSRRLADERLRVDPRLASDDSAGCRAALRRMLSEGVSLGDVG